MGSLRRQDPNFAAGGFTSLAAYGQSKLAQVGVCCPCVLDGASLTCVLQLCSICGWFRGRQGGTRGLPSSSVGARVHADRLSPAVLSCVPPLPSFSSRPAPPRPQVLFSWELQRRTGGAVVSVALHPGEVMTDVVRSLPGPLQRAYKLLLQVILLTPVQGARCSVYCATSADLEKPAAQGLYYYDSNCTPIPPSRQARDADAAAWLWRWSAQAVGLQAADDLPPPA